MKPEASLQRQVVQWLNLQKPDCEWLHIANNPRSARDGARLKKMGMRRGVADLLFIWAGHQVGWIELKSRKGRSSPHQIDFNVRMARQGCYYTICNSLDDVRRTLHAWGLIR